MINYKLFQVKNEKTREFGFMSLSMIESFGLQIDLNNYDPTYEGIANKDCISVLDILFEKFNLNHPEDFKGRSMSVSDIVQLGDDYFYCDFIGWKNINKRIKTN